MTDNKKKIRVLVNVHNLNEDEIDKALDNALDALFGPDEDEENNPKPKAVKDVSGG